MKKRHSKIWKHLYASSVYRGLSFLFGKLGMKTVSSVCQDKSSVMEYKERFGRRIERLYYKTCGGAFIMLLIYFALTLVIGQEIDLFFPFVFTILNFSWCFLMASTDSERMFSVHFQILLEKRNSFLRPVLATRNQLQYLLNDPRLVSHHEVRILRYKAEEAWGYLQLLERTGSAVVEQAVKELENNNIAEYGCIIHENFPDVYDEIFTQYSPFLVQCGTTVYAIRKEDYFEYLSMWLRAFDNHPPFLKKESTGNMYITENGQIIEDTHKEDEK